MAKKPKTSKHAARNSTSESPMDLSLLERLVKLMSANDLNMLAVRDGTRRVVLKRGAASGNSTPVFMASHTAPAHLPMSPGTAAAASSAALIPAGEDAALMAIKSPMVGTFYASPNPESQSFVSVGSTVEEETDVCIIEAMKVFNNIKAECRGVIAKILVENGQTVEFGQPLFLVKPG